MIACEHYSDLYSPTEYLKSLNNSSDTWEALENAERLLQEANKKIMQSTYDVPWLDLTLNRTSSDLDESDLNIQQRIIAKLQDLNKQKLSKKQSFSSKNKSVISSETLLDKNKICERKTEKRKICQPSVNVIETCKKCSDEKLEIKFKGKSELKAINQINDCKVKTKTRTGIINSNNNEKNFKTRLVIENVKKSKTILNPCNNLLKKHFKTVRASTVKKKSLKQNKNDDILIDVAVQTSFKDPDTGKAATLPEKVEQNPREKHAENHGTCPFEISKSPQKLYNKQKESPKIIANDHKNKVSTCNNDTPNINGELKGSFVKFLCQISRKSENPIEILPNSSKNLNVLQTNDVSENNSWSEEFYNEWGTEEINLDPPNLVNFDRVLYSLDRNIQEMIEDSNKLENLFIETESYNKHDKTANKRKNREKKKDQPFVLDGRSIDLHQRIDKSPKNRNRFRSNDEKESLNSSERNKTSEEIKFIIEPRSRISSYESVSSEVFHQQARFSTPLNNYRNVEISHQVNKKNADINCHDNEKYLISERKGNVDVNVDAKNDLKNDVNVFMTRNRLSSISCEEKNSKPVEEKIIDNKKEQNYDLSSASVEKLNEKLYRLDFHKNSDIEEHKSSSSVKYSSLSLQTNSNHTGTNSKDTTTNETTDISEKHHQELSEKSLIEVKEKKIGKNSEDKENFKVNEIEEKNKLTPASSKNDTHNRTSFEISVIYSENFEESVTEPKSILKGHDIDTNENPSSKEEIKEIHNGDIGNITSFQNEKSLSNKTKMTNTDSKMNELSKSISIQVEMDKNPSIKSCKNLLDNDEKSSKEICNNMKNELSLSTPISGPPSQKSTSTSNLNQENPKIHKKQLYSSDDYSEGEIRLPDSCSYSIGEVRIPESQLDKLTKNNETLFREILHSSSGSYSPGEIRISESMLKLKQKSNSQTQSYGEVLDTDIESSSNDKMEEGTKIMGYWILEKKRQKLNWDEFLRICHREGFILKMVDMNVNLEAQGPFDVFLHKLTDTLVFAESGDEASRRFISNIQEYISNNPEMIVIDPLVNVKNLNNRQKWNEMLHDNIDSIDIFTPKSIELKPSNAAENLMHLKKAGIAFPCICKPLLAHGSSDAHKMMILFNEKGLKDCQLPCVAQDFINHNAILYKVFIVGNYFHVVERPSLKNFYAKDCESSETLFFSSHDISKSGSKSQWSIISKDDEGLSVKPNQEIFKRIVNLIFKVFGLILVGVDVVIENHTERYGIIDVNVFPGYDGYPHVFTDLIKVIKTLISRQNRKKNNHNYFLVEQCTR